MAFPLATTFNEISEGVFPLPFIPTIPWRREPGSAAVYFGAPRTEINPDTKKPYPPHGACDLIADKDTKVLAVADGTIWYFQRFYDSWNGYKDDDGKFNVTCHLKLFELAVVHDNYIARYGEVSPTLPAGIKVGQQVQKGQHIAFVGANCASDQMLHFEMFGEPWRRDDLTNWDERTKYKYVVQRQYLRRDDLIDPTPFLDRWAGEMRQQQFEDERLAKEAIDQFEKLTNGVPKRPHAPQYIDL